MEGNQLLQKYIATRARRERELEIGTLTEVHTGFVTGLDDVFVQIAETETDDFKAVLVGLANITYVKETGSVIDDYASRARRLREYTTIFKTLSERELEKS